MGVHEGMSVLAAIELTPGSLGHDGGSAGSDVGIRASVGAPRTGGGSAPTTTGTWTITGGVPTVTTYQWFDCSSSTFSVSSCTPIEPETAPTSANGPTYTLASCDVGK